MAQGYCHVPVAALAVPLYADAVRAELPVLPVLPVLEVAEQRDGDLQVGQLITRHRAEPRILQGTGHGVLPQPVLQLHRAERPNAP